MEQDCGQEVRQRSEPEVEKAPVRVTEEMKETFRGACFFFPVCLKQFKGEIMNISYSKVARTAQLDNNVYVGPET